MRSNHIRCRGSWRDVLGCLALGFMMIWVQGHQSPMLPAVAAGVAGEPSSLTAAVYVQKQEKNGVLTGTGGYAALHTDAPSVAPNLQPPGRSRQPFVP